MPGAEDEKILSYALAKNKVVITLDKDFGYLIFKMKQKSNGVLFLRVDPQSVDFIYSLLKKAFALEIQFEKSFCVVEQHRVRIIPL